jgi:hypothetical protein
VHRDAVVAFFNVELTESHHAQDAATVAGDPGDRKPVTTGLAERGLAPPATICGFGRMPPLAPAQVRNSLDEILTVG